MKKIQLFFLLIIMVNTITAQQVGMELFSAQDKVFKNPVLIGKVGSHYMVMDELGRWPTFIYTFDSAFKLVNTTQEYISTSSINFTISDNTVNIIWKTWVRDTLSISVVKLDEKGNEIWFNGNKHYFPVKYASTPLLVTDAKRRYFLYYSLSGDGFNHDRMRGVLMDSNWTEIKTIDHSFDYDNKQSTIASPLVDAAGNIYMAVFDKLSNYHLTATVSIHRFPLANDTVITKNFQFEKTKFHEFDFKEDAGRQSIKLTGFYYDGQLRNKKGITELVFSNKGSDLLASHFYEFPPELADVLRDNLRSARKKDDPTENLRLKDIFEHKGSLFLSAWLVDMPSYQLVMDKDIDKEDPEEEKLKKNHNGGNTTYSSFEDLMRQNSNLGKAIFSYQQNQASRRLVYFSIDARGQYKYQVIPNNRYYGQGSINLNNHPLVYNGDLFFLNNNALIDGMIKKLPVTNKTVAVLKYDKAAKPSTLASFGIEDFNLLSRPAEIAPGTYLSIFRKSSLVESGLLVWKINEK